MEVVDFFKKYKIYLSDCNANPCNGCVLSDELCGRFMGCPLPFGYVFKFREKGIKGFKHHD